MATNKRSSLQKRGYFSPRPSLLSPVARFVDTLTPLTDQEARTVYLMKRQSTRSSHCSQQLFLVGTVSGTLFPTAVERAKLLCTDWLSTTLISIVDDDVDRASCPRRSADILGTNCDQYLSTVQCCFTSTETVRLVREESPGRPPRLSDSS